ncbi:preprotein translocase subunit SecE [Candidatus Dependentiae bacterium]|nr:preprotein translocase subunit SecE [Candidatus Dependentiae bacterium]
MFLNEVKAEIFKITWPSREDVVGTVIIVCFFTLVMAAILGGMDVVFGLIIKKILTLY